jgi:membrane-bound serine protease (ClpP class)
VELARGEVVLETAGLGVETVDPTWQQEFLGIITDPNIAFLLMNLGFIGLLVSFYNGFEPVTLIAGLFCVIVGLYALNTLPVNYAGAALVLLGLGLLIAEAFFTSYGLLALAGLASFAFGAILLIDTDNPAFRLDWQLIVATTLGMGILIFLVLTYGLAAQARKVVTGAEDLIGLPGRVARWANGEGYVIVDGERWRAKSAAALSEGDPIRTVKLDGLLLVVEPASEAELVGGRARGGRKAKRA